MFIPCKSMDMGLIAFVWKWCIPWHGNLCIGKLVIIHYPLFFLEGVPVFQTNPYAVTKKRKYLESYTNPQKILVECMGQNMFGIRFEVRIS